MSASGDGISSRPPPTNPALGTSPPFDDAAEQAVLGAILVEPSLIPDVRDILTSGPAAFLLPTRRELYALIVEKWDELGREGIDSLLIRDACEQRGIGGQNLDAMLSDLVLSAPSPGRAVEYAKLVQRVHDKRRLFFAAGDAFYAAQNGETPANIIAKLDGTCRAVETTSTPKPVSFGELRRQYPTQREPILDGLLRYGEVANIVSMSKWGKSWLAAGLAMSVCTGRSWLEQFPTKRGRVLVLDVELHPDTLSDRMGRVAEALSIPESELANDLTFHPLRGLGYDVFSISRLLRPADGYTLIIIDPIFRLLPPGANENDNALWTQVFNTLDGYTRRMKAGLVCVHHSTKGNQAGKSVTDIGAGGGSQSRAADTHVVLREHSEPGAAVLEAKCRTFAEPAPLCVRWSYPVWTRADDLNPLDLKQERRGGSKAAWTAQRFVEEVLTGPMDRPALKAAAAARGISDYTFRDLLLAAEGAGLVEVEKPESKRKPFVYRRLVC